MSTLSAGIIISVIYNWKLGLVIMCFIPLVIISTYFQMKILGGQVNKDKKSHEEAAKVSALLNI